MNQSTGFGTFPCSGDFFTDAIDVVVVHSTQAMAIVGKLFLTGNPAHLLRKWDFPVVSGASNEVRFVKGEHFGLPEISLDANERHQAIKVCAQKGCSGSRVYLALGRSCVRQNRDLGRGRRGRRIGKRPRAYLAAAHLYRLVRSACRGRLPGPPPTHEGAGGIGPNDSPSLWIHHCWFDMVLSNGQLSVFSNRALAAGRFTPASIRQPRTPIASRGSPRSCRSQGAR